jgi:hypothetical protein
MVVKISIYDIQSLVSSLMIGAKFDIEYRDLISHNCDREGLKLLMSELTPDSY